MATKNVSGSPRQLGLNSRASMLCIKPKNTQHPSRHTKRSTQPSPAHGYSFRRHCSSRRLLTLFRTAAMATPAAAPRHSCAKLSVAVEDPKAAGGGAIFVKATWLPTRFSLAVTDGAGAWVADASEAEVRLRAEQWDQPVSDYLSLAERYLAFQQPSSTYSFHDAGKGNRRVRSALVPPSYLSLFINSRIYRVNRRRFVIREQVEIP